MLDDNYWNETISNPNGNISIQRKVLWSILNVLMATPFEKRDEHWDHAVENTKKLLNQK